MSDPTRPKSIIPQRPPETFAVSRERFYSVPRKRAAYIFAYAVFVVAIFGPKVLLWLAGISIPPAVFTATVVVGAISFLFFAYNFLGVLRIMGYEWWVALGLAIISAPLVPGPLIIAYTDRRIATAWDKADPSGGYRQKPSSEKPT